MTEQERIDYHARRAQQEQERSQSAGAPVVAQAHIRLADLHLQRARELQGRGAA